MTFPAIWIGMSPATDGAIPGPDTESEAESRLRDGATEGRIPLPLEWEAESRRLDGAPQAGADREGTSSTRMDASSDFT